MDEARPLNLIIAGIGGQGVNTLTQVFRELAEASGIYCTGVVFKGGAQRLGSVHSEMRLFMNGGDDCDMYSTNIPAGDLDLLLGLEPWEALRHQALFGPRTVIVANTRREPFFLERTGGFQAGDPMAIMDELNVRTIRGNYTQEALEAFGTTKMLNYLVGLRTIQAKLVPFDAERYRETFIRSLDLPGRVVTLMRTMA